MFKSATTLLAVLTAGVLGYFGAYFIVGQTTFAAQAGTIGSIFAMVAFFGMLFATRSVSDGLDVRAKVKELQRNKSKVDTLRAPKDSKKLEAAARMTQRVLMMRPDVHLPKTRAKLYQAGYFSDRAMFAFILTQAALSLAGPLVGILLFLAGFSIVKAIFIALTMTTLGWFGPGVVVSSKAKTRRTKLFVEFPDSLDLLVIYVESGTAFDTALVRVIETMDKRYPTVTSELRLLEHELRFFTNRAQAFENLAMRCNIDIVSRMVAIIQQSEQIGSSIADSLKVLAKDSRDERFLLAERKAAKLPVIMQVPIVLLILPSLFLLILGPVALKMIDIFAQLTK